MRAMHAVKEPPAAPPGRPPRGGADSGRPRRTRSGLGRPVRARGGGRARRAAELAVSLAFLEFMAPDLPAAGAMAAAGCRQVTVLPLFLGAGGHVRGICPPPGRVARAAPGGAVAPGAGHRRGRTAGGGDRGDCGGDGSPVFGPESGVGTIDWKFGAALWHHPAGPVRLHGTRSGPGRQRCGCAGGVRWTGQRGALLRRAVLPGGCLGLPHRSGHEKGAAPGIAALHRTGVGGCLSASGLALFTSTA